MFRAGMVAALLVAGAVGGATAAQASTPLLSPALPTDCHISLYSDWASGWCGGGSGEYRTVIRCDNNNWFDYNRYGNWARVENGGTSAAYCDVGDDAFNPYIQKR